MTAAAYLQECGRALWSWLLLPGIFSVGALVSLRCRAPQLRLLRPALRQGFAALGGGGNRSSFRAAATALASTVGTGNIIGTAQAICLGGPGALFWMWAAAFFCMAIKYAEIALAGRDGPLDYIGALPAPWGRRMTRAYALFASLAAFGIGCLTQLSAAADALSAALALSLPGRQLDLSRLLLALGLLLAAGPPLLRGRGDVGRAAEKLVPLMSAVYLAGAGLVILCHIGRLPAVLLRVLRGAFRSEAALGAAGGLGLRSALQWGLRRGAFSNEAGLGSAALAHAEAASPPEQEALWGLFEVFVDTVLICGVTGLALLTGLERLPWGEPGGAELFSRACGSVFPPAAAAWFLALSLGLFSLTSFLSWGSFGCFCAVRLWGEGTRRIYPLCFLACGCAGCFTAGGFAWAAADLLNALMALPNLAALAYAFLKGGTSCFFLTEHA